MKTAILAAVSALALAGAVVPAQSQTISEKINVAVQDLNAFKHYAGLYGYGSFVPSGDEAVAYAATQINNLVDLRFNQTVNGTFYYQGVVDDNGNHIQYTFEQVQEIQAYSEIADVNLVPVVWDYGDYYYLDFCYGNCTYNGYNPTNAWIVIEGATGDEVFTDLVREVFKEGYAAGYKEGFEDGYDIGYKDGFIDGVRYAVGHGAEALNYALN